MAWATRALERQVLPQASGRRPTRLRVSPARAYNAVGWGAANRWQRKTARFSAPPLMGKPKGRDGWPRFLPARSTEVCTLLTNADCAAGADFYRSSSSLIKPWPARSCKRTSTSFTASGGVHVVFLHQGLAKIVHIARGLKQIPDCSSNRIRGEIDPRCHIENHALAPQFTRNRFRGAPD